MKIAIQGGAASFHDIAARKYFGENIETVFCSSFKILCDKLKDQEVDFAAMAIENSIAGSILSNYALIQKYDFHIIGEIQLRIEQNLMVLPGVKINDLKKVRSHYMALMQCEDFLAQYPSVEMEEYHDTADSARDIQLYHQREIGAIASRYAAKLYNLEIIGESIETNKQNFTRFIFLTIDKKLKVEAATKATLCFQLPDKVGSLAKVLSIIVDNNINMTKIQSLPIIGRPNEYTFYVDCEWTNYENFKKCIVLNSIVDNLKILGEYKKGEMIYDYSNR
ncbi:MAG TPA: prephenate dehydratase [Cytophagaceae bacterium]|jgi:prephenate dehydratase|nr:prephenate dehydratase [Cytophagaceae bacterium]